MYIMHSKIVVNYALVLILQSLLIPEQHSYPKMLS